MRASGAEAGVGDKPAERSFNAVKPGKYPMAKIVVVAPMPGSPAEKGRLRAGDSITDIDGKWIITYDPFEEANLEELAKAVRNKKADELTYQKAFEAAEKKLKNGMAISDALCALTSKSSGQIRIRVERSGQNKPIELNLTCGVTSIDPVKSTALKGGIVCIRISEFSARAAKEFAAELNAARVNKAKGIILDLRNNPGGLMDAASQVGSSITGGGVLAVIVNKAGRHPARMPTGRALNLPLVVLTNGGTSSVAELLAGTLRDNRTATLVGTQTFGDGMTQTPVILNDGSAAVLTTGKMLTGKGYDFDGKGIQPDRIVDRGEGDVDVQLDAGRKILLARIGKA